MVSKYCHTSVEFRLKNHRKQHVQCSSTQKTATPQTPCFFSRSSSSCLKCSMLMGSMLQGGSKPPTIPSRKVSVAGGIYELLSKLLVSPLISPIVVPYIIPHITPLRSLDYSSYVQNWVSPLIEPCLFQIYERDPNFWKPPGVTLIHLSNLPDPKLP